jgi:hypothetical protein
MWMVVAVVNQIAIALCRRAQAATERDLDEQRSPDGFTRNGQHCVTVVPAPYRIGSPIAVAVTGSSTPVDSCPS